MLADRNDTTRLCAVFAFGDRQSNLTADRQRVESAACHAVPMKIDVLALAGLNKAIPFGRQNLRHCSMR